MAGLGGMLAVAAADTGAEAKTPGSQYCYNGVCHRVKTLAQTEASIGTEEAISASFYDSCDKDGYNPCGLTSSGEVYRPDVADNAASPIYPDGTTVLVWSPANGASVVLRINNAGPYWGSRKLDVSRAAAEALGFTEQGSATLKMRVLSAPTVAEATYKARRTYDALPGYIGRFASLDAAQATATGAIQLASGSVAPTTTFDEVAAVVDVAEISPVEVATSIGVAEVDTVADETPAPRAAAPRVHVASAEPRVRPNRNEPAASRNSRSFRLAAKAQREAAGSRKVKVAEAIPRARSVVTLDGTNDMSMFSRHTYAGMERLAPQERVPQQPMRRSYARYSDRDRNDG